MGYFPGGTDPLRARTAQIGPQSPSLAKEFQQTPGNSLACMPIPVWIINSAPARVFDWIAEKPSCGFDDLLDVRTHQSGSARDDGLRTFRLFPQNQNRLAQGWRFFLNASGIGQQQVRPLNQIHERYIL